MFDTRYAHMEIEPKEMGRALACSSDENQGAVVNSFARELMCMCKDEDLSGAQVWYFAKHLDSNGRKLIRSLLEFIKLEEDSEPGKE